MATPFVENIPPPHPFDAIAADIERRYEGIVNVVRERKRTLLTRLSEFREEYDSLLSNTATTERELKSMKKDIEKFTDRDLKTMQQEFVARIEERLEQLRISANYYIQFECESEELENELSQLGELVKVDYCLPNYSEMDFPVVPVEEGRFQEPRGIAFDEETQMLYVCGRENFPIKILSIQGKFIGEFGRCELDRAWGILLYKDSIYVTDFAHCAVFQFNKNTHQLIKRVGKKGSGDGEFNTPKSLAIGPDCYIYIAEDDNNRISVLDCALNFKRFILHEMIFAPVDVQFTNKNMLILSYKSINRVHLLTLEGRYLKSIISIESLEWTYFFCLDRANNILVSFWDENLVQVYNKEGKLLHSIGTDRLKSPSGLTTTRSGKLIVVSNNKDHGFQIL